MLKTRRSGAAELRLAFCTTHNLDLPSVRDPAANRPDGTFYLLLTTYCHFDIYDP